MFRSNDDKALITIIVPIYNGESFLSECIESVLRQSYPHWELLLIDDGSSDCSAEICNRYSTLDSRISFLPLSHGGVSIARNAGLMQGQGAYFFFLDCDDLLHPQALETGLRTMQALGCAFASLTLANVEAGFRLSAHPASATPEYRCVSPTDLRNLFGSGHTELWAIGGKLLARSAVEGLFFQKDIVSAEDTLFLLDVIARNETPAVILTGIWYFRRLHQGNTSYFPTFESKIHHLDAILHLRARNSELYGKPDCWELLCVSTVFDWYVNAHTNHDLDQRPDELRKILLELLCDDYSRFLPLKRKCTARLYLFSPSLYLLLKKLYWRLPKDSSLPVL